ncbi:MAG TPA: metal-dependent transcriptional regulator [Candidatus Binatia bacterium]|nr:metal-dependent transcriptional regulator [Candidatus Binatia bacterium]
MATALEPQIEEVLERLWVARERGGSTSAGSAAASLDFDPSAALAEAQRRGWISRHNGAVDLTAAGESRAAAVMRRHRLAERLLCDVIQVDTDSMEAAACELEHSHILSEEATDRVCAFLGHPPVCPHNRPIPRGRCCDTLTRDVRPLVTPLSECAIGADFRIVFVASRSHRRLDRLAAFGVIPGARVHLHQRQPTFMIRIGGTDIAIEAGIAADVFVVPA